MTILLGFLLPVAAWVVLVRRRLGAAGSHSLATWAAFAAAAFAALAVLVCVRSTPFAGGGAEIVWTGVAAARAGEPVAVGGSSETSTCAWPSRSFSPRLEALPAADGRTAAVTVTGGGGFVRAADGFVSGTVVARGVPAQSGAYALSWSRLLPGLPLRFTVQGQGGERAVEFRVNRRRSDRVYQVGDLVRDAVDRLRGEGEEGAAAGERLRRWAADRSLLVSSRGEVRLLDGSAEASLELPLPSNLEVRWPRRSLRLSLEQRAGGRLAVAFLPVWRFSSPLPPRPEDGGDEARLTVAREAAPFENVFQLPLGTGFPDPRRTLSVVRGASGGASFAIRSSDAGVEVRRSASLPPSAPGPAREAFDLGAERGIGSRAEIEVNGTLFELGIARDLPSAWRLVVVLLIALALLLGGLRLTLPELRAVDAWVVGGLALSSWSLLSLRLLLALRYVLEPGRLDRLSVTGLAWAAAALALVPGVVLLGAALYRAQYRGLPRRMGALLYPVALVAGSLLCGVLAEGLWPNTPSQYRAFPGPLGLALLVALGGGLALVVACRAGMDRWTDAAARMPAWQLELARLPALVRLLAARVGPRLWLPVGETDEERVRLLLVDRESGRRGGTLGLLAAVVAVELVTLLGLWLFSELASKALSEAVAPLLLGWLPALLWLASRLRFLPGERVRSTSWPQLAAVTAVIVLPLFGFSLAMGDAGGVLISVCLFVPLVTLLLLARPNQVGLVALAGLLVAAALGGWVLVRPRPVLAVLPGEAGARVLVRAEGGALQSSLLFHSPQAEDDPRGVSARSLRNGLEHLWETKAIAHEGGLLGLGYGRAPVERSQVRQDTLQYDSVFTFFVLSEHGVVGGVALLLLALVPLVLVLGGAAPRFDLGHAVGALAASSLSLEGLVHAAMNLGVLPFTGRNFPLLSVNSPSDLVRWGALLALAAQAVVWRSTGVDRFDALGISVVTPMEPGLATEGAPEDPARLRRARRALLAVPLLGLLAVTVAAVANAANTSLDRPFTWSRMLATVNTLRERGALSVDQERRKVVLDPAFATGGRSMLEKEVNRFNSLPEEERLGVASAVFPDFDRRLAGVRSLDAYDDLMRQLRAESGGRGRELDPSLLELEWTAAAVDDEGEEAAPRLEVYPNEAFNVHLSFKAGRGRGDLPEVFFRPPAGGEGGGRDQLAVVGPCWVMGRWTTAHRLDSLLPWSSFLEEAALAEWRRLGEDEARARYGHLSLDRELQNRLQFFARMQGRALHQRVIRAGARERVPPRVAVTLVSIPDGEVLALGGWPRATASAAWELKRGSDPEVVPPRSWLESFAPRRLRVRYLGDRNFDRLVMGSATKPLVAAAVLGVHPGLDRVFAVRGPAGEERAVFGIPLRRGFATHASRGIAGSADPGWCDFRSYLARSDNRYEVLLGFLGLAERDGGRVAGRGRRAGATGVSMDGGASPWGQVPRYPGALGYGPDRPETLRHLETTELAASLQRTLGVGVLAERPRHLVSCWTGVEADSAPTVMVAGLPAVAASDRSASPGQLDVFRTISPLAANLELDTVQAPRDFVSILLGGRTNLWSNVEAAGAFASCVTGEPVVPHLVRLPRAARAAPYRAVAPEVARRLRPGLEAVVRHQEGTAHARLARARALDLLDGLRDVECYAKTGTLQATATSAESSRIFLALVRWRGARSVEAERGLVLSLVMERAGEGAATDALGELLAAPPVQEAIRRHFGG